ncbi:MAG: hypothetical protein A4S17_02485 [Proteobacteria bacterium HN_bin10]|jgi:hypothetical protein|nr:MAG: hypothetical protein A4S17_02485 [Proteobacteria bacterium HN_bin10]
MRALAAIASLAALAACVSPAQITTTQLLAADAATSLAVGERVTQIVSSREGGEGQDAIVSLSLRHADGRALSFQEGNHTPNDLIATGAGGALAQIMGLPGEETTRLFHATAADSQNAFFCGPDGPAAIGTYEGADGVLQIVGLRQAIAFETRADGVTEALPYSPDQVCARLRFRRG